MKFSPEWLAYPEFQEACKIIEKHSFEAYAVGGCVRDAVAEVPCDDIDITTNAHPQTIQRIFYLADWDVYPTGIDHGTVTIRKDDQSFEVTTYRHDVATDGRRATVAYAQTMEEDAKRRDFTMNALYMNRFGYVFDPTGTGVDDIVEGVVRFVGDAEQRCREDYLRIMRLFRFHAKYGIGEVHPDAANAAKKYAHMIPKVVSGERIWAELKKILNLSNPFNVIHTMDRLNVLAAILVSYDLAAFLSLEIPEKMQTFSPSWTRRFFALKEVKIPFPHATGEKKHLEMISESLNKDCSIAVSSHLYGVRVAEDSHLLMGRCSKWSHSEAERGKDAQFPVRAFDLMQLGFEPGPELGRILKEMKETWIESELTAKKCDLLKLVVHA